MPYRTARWSMLALAPIIVIAFWPGYFGRLIEAGFVLHLHAVTATAWLALLVAQLWTIHRRRPALHRALGRALFAVVPLFAASGVLAIWNTSAKVAAGDPFYAVHGAPLAIVDALSIALFVALVATAIAARRRTPRHAAAMIATALLVLPPVLGRLVPLAAPALGTIGGFRWCFHAGEALAALFAAGLYLQNRRDARAFLWVALACVVQSLMYETIGKSAWWRGIYVGIAAVPPAGLALAAAIVTLAILWSVWRASGNEMRRDEARRRALA